MGLSNLVMAQRDQAATTKGRPVELVDIDVILAVRRRRNERAPRAGAERAPRAAIRHARSTAGQSRTRTSTSLNGLVLVNAER